MAEEKVWQACRRMWETDSNQKQAQEKQFCIKSHADFSQAPLQDILHSLTATITVLIINLVQYFHVTSLAINLFSLVKLSWQLTELSPGFQLDSRL